MGYITLSIPRSRSLTASFIHSLTLTLSLSAGFTAVVPCRFNFTVSGFQSHVTQADPGRGA